MKHFTFAALTLLLIATPVRAQAQYSHVVTTSNVTSTGTLTGAPDGDIAYFTSSSGWMEFGFAQDHNGKVHIRTNMNGQTESSFDYWLMDGATITESGTINFSATADTLDVTIQNSGNVSFDRVRIFANEPLVGVDAAWIDIEEEGSAPEESDGTSEMSEPQLLAGPDLFKIYDDGNPETQHDSAVYAIDPNTGMRRPFFNQAIFYTWYTGFGDVIEISESAMAAIPLGPPMPVHHATSLVKIQSANDVFAVEAGGVLRRIATEAVARELWGPTWNARVIDIPVTEFPRYQQGDAISSAVYPDDSLVRGTSGTVWHIRNGVKRALTPAVQEVFDIQDRFILQQPPGFDPSLYTTGATYSVGEDFGWFDLN